MRRERGARNERAEAGSEFAHFIPCESHVDRVDRVNSSLRHDVCDHCCACPLLFTCGMCVVVHWHLLARPTAVGGHVCRWESDVVHGLCLFEALNSGGMGHARGIRVLDTGVKILKGQSHMSTRTRSGVRRPLEGPLPVGDELASDFRGASEEDRGLATPRWFDASWG